MKRFTLPIPPFSNILKGLFLIFLLFSSQLFSQGVDCGTSTSLSINGLCDSGNINDATISTLPIGYNCGDNGNGIQREGWYQFTVTTGLIPIQITATGNRNLALQLISSTGPCADLAQIMCVNALPGSGVGNSTEILTTSLNNGTYYIRVLNVGGNNNMSLQSICITSPENIVPASGNNSYILCSGNLYDSGGSAGNYTNNSDGYTVLNPAIPGNMVQVSGNITAEGGYDYLTIYDGVGTGGTVLWGGSPHGTGTSCQTFTVPMITSTTGPLTVRFYSDISNVCSGFSLAVNCYLPPPCAGTPTGGTASVNPIEGSSGSYYTVSASGYSTGTGLSYQWQSNTNNGGWVNAGGSTTSYANYTATAPAGLGTTVRWRLQITCTNPGGSSATSTEATFTVGYCMPLIDEDYEVDDTYINQVRFLGTLNDVTHTSTYSTNPWGYQNWTGLSNLSRQAQGEGVNVYMQTSLQAYFKAWIDWNKDGDFEDAGELVYDAGDVGQTSTTFGFIIPDTTPIGDYRIRMRVSEFLGPDIFNSCEVLNYWGEAEDYLFTVEPKCDAKILTITNGSRCGAGDVEVSATGTPTTSKIYWHTQEVGGTFLGSSDPGTNFILEDLTEDMFVYAEAHDETDNCQSTYRVEVRAEIKPLPEINFESSVPEVCGDNVIIEVTAEGDDETIFLVNEDFEAGGLGVFTVNNIQNNGAGTNALTQWQSRISTFQPTGPTWKPAISSGINGNHFVMATSDVYGISLVNTALVSPSFDTTDFINLSLKFKMYFSRYNPNNSGTGGEYIALEYSTNGNTWNPIPPGNIVTDIGQGTKFNTLTYNLTPYVNNANFQFRIRYYAGWTDGVAVDNIQFVGTRPLAPAFTWDDSNISVYTDPEATVEYEEGTPASVVYIQPSDEQLELYEILNVTATAELLNGCSATGTIEIPNKNKVWNTLTASNWATLNWKPGPGVPTADHCVLVRTPVFIPSATDGLAKNLKVETGGSLTIQSGGSLTLTDFLINETTAADFIVESDASLLQTNPGAPNSGEITVRRAATVPWNQYNYWSSPVVGQDLYNLYDNIPNNRVMTYNTWDNYFTIVPMGTLSSFGVGYSIKGPSTGGPGVLAEFIGVPHNESTTATDNRIPLSISYDGYNLIGNPFPSNLNLDMLYNLHGNNNAITGTYYFWDNTNNLIYVQQGSGYTGNNYAIYNANSTGGTPASGGDLAKIPNGIVKPGQGFIVNELAGASYLTVDNTMRTKEVKMDPMDPLEPEAPYYKNENEMNDTTPPRKDKFWVELITPGGIHTKILIGYFEEAENTFEKFDSKILNPNASDNFYSFSKDDQKLSIQGRQGPFQMDDVIPLGVKMFQSGHHIIQVDERMGIFISYQDVYLKDRWLNVIHNISETGYEFESINGLFEDRFEIVFRDGDSEEEPILTTSNAMLIQKIDHQIVISSKDQKIAEVEIFDLMNRSLYKNKAVFNQELKIQNALFGKQIIVVNVLTETGEWVSKKLVMD